MRLPPSKLAGKTPEEQRENTLSLIRRRAVLAAVVLAVSLRVVGLEWGLPGPAHSASYHPDEGTIYGHALQMAKTGDLNPHFFNYGSLPIMLSALVLKLTGLDAPGKISAAHYALRLVSVAAGVLTVWLAALIAGRLFRSGWAPALAAAATAAAPLAVVNSHYATVDALATCLLTASLYFSVRLLDEDDAKWYLLAGALAGLAAATKYVGAMAILPAIAAHAIRSGSLRSVLDGRAVGLVAGPAIAAFLIGCPYSVLDHQAFLRDFAFEMRHVREGATTYMLGQPPLVYFVSQVLPCALSLPLLCVSAVGLAFGIAAFGARGALLGGWALLLILLHGSGKEIFVRYAMPLVPLFAIGLASLAAPIDVDEARGLLAKPFQRGVAVAVVGLAVLWAALVSWANVSLMAGPDTREQAARRLLPEYMDGGSLGMHKLPWFDTPPLLFYNAGPHYPPEVYFDAAERMGVELTITGWDVGVLRIKEPERFVSTEFDYHYPLLADQPKPEAFYDALQSEYALESEFSAPLRAGPIEFQRPRLHDWRYVCPEIRIYRRLEAVAE
ncbi:MAG: phospholipid carrier-dependent glycosyltransferase [Armatimonadia bacterium]|nr:phospholipid carrier-dependent glycosyltransferase [Armatimonadia bacterium]